MKSYNHQHSREIDEIVWFIDTVILCGDQHLPIESRVKGKFDHLRIFLDGKLCIIKSIVYILKMMKKKNLKHISNVFHYKSEPLVLTISY